MDIHLALRSNHHMNDVKLPASVQEIADVIGVDRALYLVGQLPRYYCRRRCSKSTSWETILYVPKTLHPDHPLIQQIGYHDAMRLVKVFGGEILRPASCSYLIKEFRNKSIRRMVADGIPTAMIASWMGISQRHVRNIAMEKARED